MSASNRIIACSAKEAEVISPRCGVEIRTLVCPADTASRRFCLRHLTLKPSEAHEFADLREETIYYIVSGRGTLTVVLENAPWKLVLETDMAIWMPPGIRHAFKNTGEGNLRCMSMAYKLNDDIYDREAQGAIWNFKIVRKEGAPAYDYVGYVNRVIFSEAELKALGAKNISIFEFETIHPTGMLQPTPPILPHMVDREEAWYFLRGEAEFVMNDRERVLRPGDAVYLPAGIKHSIANVSGEDLVQYLIAEI